MANKHKYLIKNVFLFSINNFIPKLLSILLIPLYTNCLTTAEYGVSDLITTTVSLLIPIFTLDIQDAVLRFALDKQYKKEDVFSVAFRINLSGTGLVCLGTYIVSLFNIPGLNDSYLFFFVVMYFTTALYNTVSLFCRGIDKISVLVASGVLNSVVTLSANIVFLLVFEWGLTGYLLANTLGSVLALVWCFVGAKLHRYITKTTAKGIFKDMISFSFPLVFSVIAWWANNASSRYILSGMCGVAISGLFAIAYKIPNILTVFQNIFFQAWSISAIKEFDKDDSDGFIGNMYNLMNFAMIAVCSGIILLNIPLSNILYSKEFFEAWKFVPPLLLSVVFNAMSLFIGSIFTAVKDTKTLSVSTIVGAVVNVICNFVFIYYWDAYGAALATMIGYAVVLLMRHIILRRHIHMRIVLWRDLAAYGILALQMALAFFGSRYVLLQVVAVIAIVLLYVKEIKQLFLFVKRRFV